MSRQNIPLRASNSESPPPLPPRPSPKVLTKLRHSPTKIPIELDPPQCLIATSTKVPKPQRQAATPLHIPKSPVTKQESEGDGTSTSSIVSKSDETADIANFNDESSEKCIISSKKSIPNAVQSQIRHCSSRAYKFFMEQHIENVLKSHYERLYRKIQLEIEMRQMNLSAEAQDAMRKMLNQKENNYIRLKRSKIDKTMFTRLKKIGHGAFAEVFLVHRTDKPTQLYAMKTLKKSDVLSRNQMAHVKAERDILAESDNEWVVKLYFSFQDYEYLYFVMDFVPGGDLMSLLIKLRIFSESLARFYIAELTMAIESVHKMGFIHRDIKPDNILIDHSGHIKLTDFGLCTGFRWTHNSNYYQLTKSQNDLINASGESAKNSKGENSSQEKVDQQRNLAYSVVGTPNYIAPEVLKRTGYTESCDWWSVGVIFFEMVIGYPPFLAKTAVETQQKIINWRHTLQIPSGANISREAIDLILKLCTSESNRLGKNIDEIKGHPFFSGVKFDANLRKRPAPYVPKIDYPTDTSNFDDFDSQSQHEQSNDASVVDSHGFFGFTYRRFFTNTPTLTKDDIDGIDEHFRNTSATNVHKNVLVNI